MCLEITEIGPGLLAAPLTELPLQNCIKKSRQNITTDLMFLSLSGRLLWHETAMCVSIAYVLSGDAVHMRALGDQVKSPQTATAVSHP